MTAVAPGQVWLDRDKRSAGRALRVVRIEGEYAVCLVISDGTAKRRSHWATRPAGWTSVGTLTRIKVERFRPTSNGYIYQENDCENH